MRDGSNRHSGCDGGGTAGTGIMPVQPLTDDLPGKGFRPYSAYHAVSAITQHSSSVIPRRFGIVPLTSPRQCVIMDTDA